MREALLMKETVLPEEAIVAMAVSVIAQAHGTDVRHVVVRHFHRVDDADTASVPEGTGRV